MLTQFENIIWDWNGTLLNDQKYTMDCINRVLLNRNLSPLDTQLYREAFGFPIRDYYQRIGLNSEEHPFESAAEEFIDIYYSNINQSELHIDVEEVLQQLHLRGKRQFVLSAMEQNALVDTLTNFGIYHSFEHISGLNDHNADSKLENGIRLLREYKLDPKLTVLIGDTNHDAQVAQEIGCRCILFDKGHQSNIRLKATGNMVISNLIQLLIPRNSQR